MTEPDPREIVMRWIELERAGHADVKYSGANLDLRDEANRSGDWASEINFVLNYLKRAELFGFNTLQGLQALGKAAVTVIAEIERTLVIHGLDMPAPGVPSGQIEAWT